MKKLNRKGFTLIELLAVITVLAIVSTISIYVMINVIGNTKEKSYQVTINNIVSAAGEYLKENSNKLFFISTGTDNKEYQCITVQNLIDTGYFDNTVLKSQVSNEDTVQSTDYIYLERDEKTKAITKSSYPSNNTICGNAINSKGDIRFNLSPSGWSKEKNLTINYIVKNSTGNEKNAYKYDTENGIKDKANESTNANNIEDLTIIENGTMSANIKSEENVLVSKNIIISQIDNQGPKIKFNYTGDPTVQNKVTIPIEVTDYGTGLNMTSFTTEDIKVFVGDTEITSASGTNRKKELKLIDSEGSQDTKTYEYELIITSDTNGELVITIDDETFEDKLGNPNEGNTNDGITFNNMYYIKFDSNGGTGSMQDMEMTYNEEKALTANTYTKIGNQWNQIHVR